MTVSASLIPRWCYALGFRCHKSSSEVQVKLNVTCFIDMNYKARLKPRSFKWMGCSNIWSVVRNQILFSFLISIHDLIDFSFKLLKKGWCVSIDFNWWLTSSLPICFCLLLSALFFVIFAISLKLFWNSFILLCPFKFDKIMKIKK